jgi:hypothetical protein
MDVDGKICRYNHRGQAVCHDCADWFYYYRRTLQYRRNLRRTTGYGRIHQVFIELDTLWPVLDDVARANAIDRVVSFFGVDTLWRMIT